MPQWIKNNNSGGHMVVRNHGNFGKKRQAREKKQWDSQNGPVVSRKATAEELASFGLGVKKIMKGLGVPKTE